MDLLTNIWKSKSDIESKLKIGFLICGIDKYLLECIEGKYLIDSRAKEIKKREEEYIIGIPIKIVEKSRKVKLTDEEK